MNNGIVNSSLIQINYDLFFVARGNSTNTYVKYTIIGHGNLNVENYF